MAKDPAMLWYWGDWHSGTSLFSRFLKGCYMDVLHAQFNNGRLSLEEIKICLGSDFGAAWPTLQKKFKQDENGLFFNERLEQEKNKRKQFTESRRNNLQSKAHKATHMDDHTEQRMENENENKNVIDFKLIMVSGKKITNPVDVLRFYEVQLNGMTRENNNVAWEPFVDPWFNDHLGEDFTDAQHVKNSFKRFYLSRMGKGKEIKKSLTAQEIFNQATS